MFVTVTTKHVCGIDLHARTMSVCAMAKNGLVVLKKTIDCSITTLSSALNPIVKVLLWVSSQLSTGIGSLMALRNVRSPVIWAIPSMSNA
jgi:hypothetical protein